MIKPLGDRLLVRVLEEDEQRIGGVIIPENAREKPQRAEVLRVGPGALVDGERIPVDVAVGDTVVFSKYGGTEVTIDGEELLILREVDVFGVEIT